MVNIGIQSLEGHLYTHMQSDDDTLRMDTMNFISETYVMVTIGRQYVCKSRGTH